MYIPCKLLSLYTHNPVFIKNALVNNVITVWENLVKHTNFILEFLGLHLPVCVYEINSDSYIVAFCFFVSSFLHTTKFMFLIRKFLLILKIAIPYFKGPSLLCRPLVV